MLTVAIAAVLTSAQSFTAIGQWARECSPAQLAHFGLNGDAAPSRPSATCSRDRDAAALDAAINLAIRDIEDRTKQAEGGRTLACATDLVGAIGTAEIMPTKSVYTGPRAIQAMRRVGAAPMHELFTMLAGPGPRHTTHFAGRLVVAIDGTRIAVADTDANRTRYPTHSSGPNGAAGYPMIRLVAIIATGTRALIDAAFGSDRIGELTYAATLAARLTRGMPILGDRNFSAGHSAWPSTLVELYHRRWDIETTYCELKSSILNGHVLRGRHPAAIEQQIWALLTCYQALRTAMLDRPDIPSTDSHSPSPTLKHAINSSTPPASSPAPPTSSARSVPHSWQRSCPPNACGPDPAPSNAPSRNTEQPNAT